MRRSMEEGGGRSEKLEQSPPPPHTVWFPKNLLKDEFDNTFDIGDFRVHIFCPQTQELPEKHHEAGPPERLPTAALRKSITDTLDTVKIAKRFACANEQHKIKGHFGTSEGSMRIAEWKMSPSPPTPHHHPHISKRSAASGQKCFVA